MFNTRNIVVEVNQVPSYWVFQYYLNLQEVLSGQDVKIKSVWNTGEKTPSMCIYVDRSRMEYVFKDFSTGRFGDKINLLIDLFDLNYASACDRLIYDYNVYIKNKGKIEITLNTLSKWELDYIHPRNWNTDDANYWLSYGIGKSMLELYNVKPLEFYTISKDENGSINNLKIEAKYIYAYCDSDYKPYKIYQPFNKTHKFHKVKSHIQGLDQLSYKNPYLVICSSLKDAMCLKGFGYNIDVIAPDSENSIIKPYIIDNLKKKYKKIITLFDNDEAGQKAIEKYADTYNINGTVLNLSKDVSDSVKTYGFDTVHNNLKPLLKEAIHKI